ALASMIPSVPPFDMPVGIDLRNGIHDPHHGSVSPELLIERELRTEGHPQVPNRFIRRSFRIDPVIRLRVKREFRGYDIAGDSSLPKENMMTEMQYHPPIAIDFGEFPFLLWKATIRQDGNRTIPRQWRRLAE